MISRRPKPFSIVCWTNNNDDFTPDWRVCSAATAASNEPPGVLVWTWTPSPGVNANCAAAGGCAGGFDHREAAAGPWKKTPEILNRLRSLLREDTTGDPMGRRGLWTGKRLREFSTELAGLGLRVGPNTVRRLLAEIGYALHANRNSLCAEVSPWREAQFSVLNFQRAELTRSGYPIISVDTKKKELVRRFKNNGRVWSRAPIRGADHDFRSQAKGMAIPYGIYDLNAIRGMGGRPP